MNVELIEYSDFFSNNKKQFYTILACLKQTKYNFNLFFIHIDKYMLISILCATNETMHIQNCMY